MPNFLPGLLTIWPGSDLKFSPQGADLDPIQPESASNPATIPPNSTGETRGDTGENTGEDTGGNGAQIRAVSVWGGIYPRKHRRNVP